MAGRLEQKTLRCTLHPRRVGTLERTNTRDREHLTLEASSRAPEHVGSSAAFPGQTNAETALQESRTRGRRRTRGARWRSAVRQQQHPRKDCRDSQSKCRWCPSARCQRSALVLLVSFCSAALFLSLPSPLGRPPVSPPLYSSCSLPSVLIPSPPAPLPLRR